MAYPLSEEFGVGTFESAFLALKWDYCHVYRLLKETYLRALERIVPDTTVFLGSVLFRPLLGCFNGLLQEVRISKK